jgi:hypothetical protein
VQCPNFINLPLCLALLTRCLTKEAPKFQHKCNTKLTLELDLTHCTILIFYQSILYISTRYDFTFQANIQAALDMLCGYLPPSIKSECNNLVKEYGPEIIKLLVQELSPDVICKQLGLCSSQKGMIF